MLKLGTYSVLPILLEGGYRPCSRLHDIGELEYLAVIDLKRHWRKICGTFSSSLIIGSSTSPLQSLYSSTASTRITTALPNYLFGRQDISDHFPGNPGPDPTVLLLASKLMATSTYDPQIKLWTPKYYWRWNSPAIKPDKVPYQLNTAYSLHNFSSLHVWCRHLLLKTPF